MALIFCRSCGRKISNTVDKCIHCGCEINKEFTVPPCTHQNEKNEQDSRINLEKTTDYVNTCNENQSVRAEPKKARVKSYETLGAQERIDLEKEFLAQDKWAKKYRKNQYEHSAYGTMATLLWMFCLGAFAFYLFVIKQGSITHTGFVSEVWMMIFFASICALMIYFIASIIIAAVLKIKSKCEPYSNIKDRIYEKKFRKWLLENKNVDYLPKFEKMDQRKIFESIDLEKIKL